jgi:hypothetical protein
MYLAGNSLVRLDRIVKSQELWGFGNQAQSSMFELDNAYILLKIWAIIFATASYNHCAPGADLGLTADGFFGN